MLHNACFFFFDSSETNFVSPENFAYRYIMFTCLWRRVKQNRRWTCKNLALGTGSLFKYHSGGFQHDKYNNHLSPGKHLAITNTTLKRKSTESATSVSLVFDCIKLSHSGHCKHIYFYLFKLYLYNPLTPGTFYVFGRVIFFIQKSHRIFARMFVTPYLDFMIPWKVVLF